MEEGKVVIYESGASRDSDEDKLDFEGFLSPLVLEAYGEYMHFNRLLPDGTLRDGDNWQKGFPYPRIMKSGWRHFFDWWMEHRGWNSREGIVFAICGLIFNASAYLHKVLLSNPDLLRHQMAEAKKRRGDVEKGRDWGFMGGVGVRDTDDTEPKSSV